MEIDKNKSYGVTVATLLAVLQLYLYYNELMITSRPNVVVVSLSCDTLITRQMLTASWGKPECVFLNFNITMWQFI